MSVPDSLIPLTNIEEEITAIIHSVTTVTTAVSSELMDFELGEDLMIEVEPLQDNEVIEPLDQETLDFIVNDILVNDKYSSLSSKQQVYRYRKRKREHISVLLNRIKRRHPSISFDKAKETFRFKTKNKPTTI